MQHEVYLSDLEIWLRDKLRDQLFYPFLRRIAVAPSNQHACGWAARVSGDLTCAEQALCAGIVHAMQRRYDLTTKRDFHLYVAAEPTEQVAVHSMRSA